MFDIPPNKISTVNNGIRLVERPTNRSKNELKLKYGFSEQDEIILFAGSVRESKGVYDLVNVFEKLVDRNCYNLKLVIAGAGDLPFLLQKVKKYWSRIIITGSLDKPTLYDFMKLSDIGVVPSYVEQCSYTAIEMMQIGLPIVVSDVDGLREIVPNDCGLKVKVNFIKNKHVHVNVKQLETKLEYLLQNKTIAIQ